MDFIKQLVDRFKEPSSWAGVVGLIAAFGVNLPQGYVTYGVATLAGIAGILSIVLSEKPAS